jgi:hypothetical protein
VSCWGAIPLAKKTKKMPKETKKICQGDKDDWMASRAWVPCVAGEVDQVFSKAHKAICGTGGEIKAGGLCAS